MGFLSNLFGGSNETTTKVENTIPKEIAPFVPDTLQRGYNISTEPYMPYTGQRLADVSADSKTSYDMIRGIASAGMPQTDAAMGMVNNIYGDAGNIGANGPYQFSAYNYGDAGTFSGEGIGAYMSPYMQRVVDAQKAAALEDFQMANGARAAQAVNAGAFGGSRAAVQQGLAERDYLTRANDIEAQGLQKSYEDAQKMFELDRQARMKVDENRAAELSRVQAGQAADNLNYENLGLDALKVKSMTAGQLSDLEARKRAGDIEAAKLLSAQGKETMAYQQAGLDIGYGDYLRQLGYPKEQVDWMMSLTGQAPGANATNTTTTQTQPSNPLKDLFGAGITAYSLYNAYNTPTSGYGY